MLSVRNLSVWYGAVQALKGVSLEVLPGEVVCVVGPNGAGKSSLLRAVSGQVPRRQGVIEFEGEALHQMSTVEIVRAGVVHCPEGRDLFDGLTVEENIKLGTTRRSQPFKALTEDLDLLTDLFPIIRERWRQRAATLSGGEQQMVALARAVIANPRLLLLDEPALGLAPKLVAQLFSTIPRIVERGTSIVLVEQNVRAALGVANRGYLLRTGSVELAGDRDELRKFLVETPGYLR